MPDTGYIQVIAVTGRAQVPLENVAITVTTPDGTSIAMALTDRNGTIRPISLPAPSPEASLKPDTGLRPYTPVNVYARLDGYEQMESEDLQVFPNVTTRLILQMIPLAEFPEHWDKTVLYRTPPQNL